MWWCKWWLHYGPNVSHYGCKHLPNAFTRHCRYFEHLFGCFSDPKKKHTHMMTLYVNGAQSVRLQFSSTNSLTHMYVHAGIPHEVSADDERASAQPTLTLNPTRLRLPRAESAERKGAQLSRHIKSRYMRKIHAFPSEQRSRNNRARVVHVLQPRTVYPFVCPCLRMRTICVYVCVVIFCAYMCLCMHTL